MPVKNQGAAFLKSAGGTRPFSITPTPLILERVNFAAMIYDAAVVIPTVLRRGLLRAVRSVYAQDLKGTVQVMVGVDINKGDAAILDTLRAECPKHMQFVVLDLGYSTNAFNGGFYPIRCGGALKTILSYAANARYIAYLDDDNWYAPSHLADLLRTVKDKAWAFS